VLDQIIEIKHQQLAAEKCRLTFLSRVEFEPMIAAFERPKSVRFSDCAATWVGVCTY